MYPRLYLTIVFCLSFLISSPSFSETYECQASDPEGNYLEYLNDFAELVDDLTDGEVEFEFLAAGSLVKTNQILDAVHSNEIPCGVSYTHYWDKEHPAAMLFGSPIAGAGLGIDNISFYSWFMYGGGEKLYNRLWREMERDVVGFYIAPFGPEALGWFTEPIETMDDFRNNVEAYRAPPGLPGKTYSDVGVNAVTMGAKDLLPALEQGIIDAAEWCCPAPDREYGIAEVLKHYYLQGLHQVVVNGDLIINKDVFKDMDKQHQLAIETAAQASLMKFISMRIYENGKALEKLQKDDGIELHDTPDDYFTEYSAAAYKNIQELKKTNNFFAEVYDSMEKFAKIAVPYWSNAQLSNAKLGKAYADTLE